MHHTRLSLHATCREPVGVIPMLVGEAVQAVGGWVTDVHALGSLQVVVAFVIPDGQHHALRRALGAATFQLQESHWEAEGREGEIAGAITVIPRDG